MGHSRTVFGVFCLLAVFSCSLAQRQAATSERETVSGVIVEINNLIPRDGGAVIFKLQDKRGQIVAVAFRGPNLGYRPTFREEGLLRDAMRLEIGDWIEVELIEGGWVWDLRTFRE